MKAAKILAAAVMSVAAMTASASEEMDYCSGLANDAMTIVDARDAGVTLDDLKEEIVKLDTHIAVKEVYLDIANFAYTSKLNKIQIAKKVLLTCYASVTNGAAI